MKNKTDILAVTVASLALLLSVFTYFRTEKMQEEISAYTIWQNYLQLATTHPGFAQGIHLKNDSTYSYEWFVGSTLGSAEIVLLLQDNDPAWSHTIKNVLKNHVDYFKTDDFQLERGDYAPILLKIIDEVIKESKSEKKK
jgi:hypothetical protein